MDRIRAGLTGLGAVFLVTAAASLLFAPDEAQTVASALQEPGEPLAQLGVAPGSDKIGSDKIGSDNSAGGAAGDVGGGGELPAEPGVPLLEAQPSGGPPVDGAPRDPAYPSPTGSGGAVDPGRPVAI
jgi:hypothetical protein